MWQDTGKKGVDLVFDSVGEEVWQQCLKALGVGGRLVTYGATTGACGVTELRVVFWKQLSILGSTMGTPAEFRKVMRLVFQGRLLCFIIAVLEQEGGDLAAEAGRRGDEAFAVLFQ